MFSCVFYKPHVDFARPGIFILGPTYSSLLEKNFLFQNTIEPDPFFFSPFPHLTAHFQKYLLQIILGWKCELKEKWNIWAVATLVDSVLHFPRQGKFFVGETVSSCFVLHHLDLDFWYIISVQKEQKEIIAKYSV